MIKHPHGRAWLATGVMAVALLVAGAWIGEGEYEPIPRLIVFGFLDLVVASLVAFVCRRVKLVQRVAAVCATVVFGFGGFWIGARMATSAFNSCIERGEDVRLALQQFKRRRGHYPASLEELGMDLPGGRLLRGNILHYEPHPDGYSLSFSDWLVSHSATETGAWEVHK